MRGLTKASVFFFEKLSQHSSRYVQSLSAKLVPLVSDLPRLQNYIAERDFTHAAKSWKKKVEELRIELDRLRDSEKDEAWYTWLDDIVALLEGRGDVVKRICYDLGCEWKEVCAVWGVFVDPRMRRADIP
jgi:nuclear pore complex protein Nup85